MANWLMKILGADGTNQLKIDSASGSSIGSARTSSMPYDYGTGGHYGVATVSGVLPAALAANAVIASFRWGDSSFICVPTYVKVSFQALTAFTAATLTDFGFDLVVGRSFTASHTGGTGLVLTGNNAKMRTSMTTSRIATNGDIRVATIAALGGGTLTLDSNAIANSIGDQQRVNPAAATEEQRVNDPTLEWKTEPADGEHHLTFAQNEGFVIRNRAVWPAAGTGTIAIQIRWMELPLTMLA